MNQNVLHGVVEIEGKAARIVDEAKSRASEAEKKVQADLDALARELDEGAEQESAAYSEEVEGRKSSVLARLDQQLDAAMAALRAVQGDPIATAAAEVASRVEQRTDGN